LQKAGYHPDHQQPSRAAEGDRPGGQAPRGWLRTLAAELTAEITLLETAIADLLEHHDGYRVVVTLDGAARADLAGPAGRWAVCPWVACDDLRLVGLKLIFLIQLAAAQRKQPRAHARLTCSDRAWLALLAGDAADRACRRIAADRHSGHALALASRHPPPPMGAPIAPRPLGTSTDAP
jgi:hypothetical protein